MWIISCDNMSFFGEFLIADLIWIWYICRYEPNLRKYSEITPMLRPIILILSLMLLSRCSSEKPAGRGNDAENKGNSGVIGLTLQPGNKPIGESIFGYNTQSIKGPGWDEEEFIDRIVELNPGNFRYPGGTVGNFWDWRTGYYNEIGKEANVIAPLPTGPFPYKLDHVKRVYDRTGISPVYVINMLTSSCDEQLAMLKYARSIGLPVKYIEMGNEYYMDDHPKNYTYPTVFPEITDYTDMCRIWTARFRQEFPDVRIALVGVTSPAAWTKRPRTREWNTVVMNNRSGIECDAMAIHIYPKNGLDSPMPYDMIGQSLASVAADKILDESIDSEYGLWVTEYNFESGSNPFPGLWVHGLAASLMSAQLIATPRIEMVCFFNLTAGKNAAAIFDADVSIQGKPAPKYALSAAGEGLKILSRAQHGATAVTTVGFSDNPQLSTQKHGKIDMLYGYLFGGAISKLLLINLDSLAHTIAVDGLGFTPASFEQVSGHSLETPVTSPSSLTRLSGEIGTSGQIELQPYSMTVVW